MSRREAARHHMADGGDQGRMHTVALRRTLVASTSALALTLLGALVTTGGAVAQIVVGNGDIDPGSYPTSGSPAPSWNVGTILTVGVSDIGTLAIEGGGTVSSAYGYIGRNPGGIGTVTATGSGSIWDMSPSYSAFIGFQGTGTVNIEDGAVVSNGYGYIGHNSGSRGSVTATGPGSTWTNAGDLYVGYNGAGILTIADGATVSSRDGYIGYDSEPDFVTFLASSTPVADSALVPINLNGTGGVAVSGAGSTWDVSTGDLFVGYAGRGVLTIEDGGKVVSERGSIGYDTGSEGTVIVSGSGSIWDTGPYAVDVGNLGIGTLTIERAGTVNSGNGFIGTVSDGNGTVTVTGGAAWNTGTIYVGYDGVGTLNVGAYDLSETAGTIAAIRLTTNTGHGTVNFNQTDDIAFAVPIEGNIGVNQRGSGTTILTGINTHYGDTTVSGGALLVNGSILNSAVTVQSGARLGGNGSIGNTVVRNGGILAPGNSIDTLSVADIQFQPGSIYEVELNDGGNGAGINNDHINASGTATINGGTIHVTPENGTDEGTTYTPETTYTILTAAAGRSGEFEGVTDDYAFLDFTDTYDGNNVYLTSALVGGGTGTCPIDLTFNQDATCGGVLSIGNGDLYTAIINLSNAEAPVALDQLSGEIHASIGTALIEDSRFPREAALERLRASFEGAETTNGPSRTLMPINDALAFWSHGFGSWSDWDGDSNAAELNRSIGGFLLGGEALVRNNVRLGALAGYGHSSFKVKDRASSGSANTWHLGAYGGTEFANLGLRFGGAYAWHDIEVDRSTAFTGFSDRLSSSYDAQTGQVFGDIGYRVDYGTASIEPFANLAYVHLKTDGYSEAGGEAALTADEKTQDTTFTTIGLRAQALVSLGDVPVRLSGAAEWRHSFGDLTPFATHAFAEGDDFTVLGLPIAKDAFVLDLRAAVNLSENATLDMAYSAQFGSGFSDQGFRANLAVQF